MLLMRLFLLMSVLLLLFLMTRSALKMDFNHTPYWSHFLLAEQPTTDEDQEEEDFRLCNFLQVAHNSAFYIKNCFRLCNMMILILIQA